jgi:RHS repeat-associated protein
MSDSGSSQCKGLQWVYDAWGNRLQQNTTAGSCFSPVFVVGTNNRISTGPYQYDSAGNMIADGNHTYSYDAENELTKVDGGTTATYYYDVLGRRVGKQIGSGVITEYLRDLAGNVIADKQGSNWATFYLYFGGALTAEYTASTTQFIFRDHLGSTRLVTAMDRSVLGKVDYQPFGEQTPGASATTHKFTGKERDDESGLDSFGKRYYTSTMGRWTSPDLVNVTEDRVVNPANTLNKYVYGGNNPLKYIDPDGQDITYFYDPGGVAGHAVLFAYNQATGDSAIESFGPKVSAPVWTGESNFDMGEFSSAQALRDNYASLTIQTTPELTQQVIDYIRANPDPKLWTFLGPNCSSEVQKILSQFKLNNPDTRNIAPLWPGISPKALWYSLLGRYNPSQAVWGHMTKPVRGRDYGNARYDMFNLLWLSLRRQEERVHTRIISCEDTVSHTPCSD